MSTVRLNYDGWLALPATVRQRLGLTTGDPPDLELLDRAITPRACPAPARRGPALPPGARRALDPVAGATPLPRGGAAALPGRSTAEPVATGAPELPAATAPVRKGAAARSGKSPLPVIPPALKARGGKRKDVPVTVR